MFSTTKASIVASTIARNLAQAAELADIRTAAAKGGGGSIGGGTGTSIVNSTVASNRAKAFSAAGGTALVVGGGLILNNGSILTSATIARNSATPSGGDPITAGGGLQTLGTVLEGTILALNTGAGSPNCAGTVISHGHNLVGPTTGCSYAPKPSDRHSAPKLGTLGVHGGPTPTIPLLSGSPAIDAIPVASCPVHVDQRGVSRPQGPRCDIGAFERRP